MATDSPQSPADVVGYYATFAEESRLATGAPRLEFERTKEILARVLPPPPARVTGFGDVQVLGVEGIGEWLIDFRKARETPR